MNEMTLLIILLIVVVIFGIGNIVFMVINKPKIDTQAMIDKQKDANQEVLIKITREYGDLKEHIVKTFSETSKTLTQDLSAFQEKLMSHVDERMEKINQKVELRLTEGFEKSSKTFENVLQRLTRIDEAQKQIEKLSTEVVSLKDILSDKKSRGVFGEVQLKNILSAIFGDNNKKIFDMQVKLSTGVLADAVLYAPDPLGTLCIDSKFPLENYKRMMDKELSEEERKTAEKLFKTDVKKHIDAIANKYIIPNETSDQAIMFIPAEAIFAEINAYHGELVEYGQKRSVWLTSPTTLMASLTSIQILIRNIERDRYSKIIHEELNRLSEEFGRYQKRWDQLKNRIESVHKSVDEIHTTSHKIGKRFESISKVEIEGVEPPEISILPNENNDDDD